MCLGIPGKLIEIEDEEDAFMRVGRVSFGGSVKEVSLAYVPDARVGDYVVVHAGFALNILNEDEATEVFGYLKEIEIKLKHEEQQKSESGESNQIH